MIDSEVCTMWYNVPCGTQMRQHVARPERTEGPRQRLLDAAIDHVAAHGIGDLSLRELAAAIGTSHRMLIYHFGSKEGLLVAIVDEVEARQRQLFAAFAAE